MSVTDRFLAELGPIINGVGQLPKDADVKYENLVKGLRHIQIKAGSLALVLLLDTHFALGLAI